MKIRTILKLFLISSILILFDCFREIKSSNMILKCNGEIPKKVACLIEATSYKVNIARIDICKDNPFPAFRSNPDYERSSCIKLFNEQIISKNLDLGKGSIFRLSSIQKDIVDKGEYQYLSIIFKNKFKVSGKYNSGKVSYKTSSKGPKDIVIDNNLNSKPSAFTEKFTNWRGKTNKDNKYCSKGGTFSRCDLMYNGNNLTVIGLDSDYEESYGNGTKYLFYLSKLSKPAKIDDLSKGDFQINLIKNLEVYGNGKSVKSISVAPFIFRAIYLKN